MLWFLTSCLTEGTCRSRRSVVFGTYRGALVIILSILDWKRSRVSMLEFDAVPHSCIPYVHIGFRMAMRCVIAPEGEFRSKIIKCRQAKRISYSAWRYFNTNVYLGKYYITVLCVACDLQPNFITNLLINMAILFIYHVSN